MTKKISIIGRGTAGCFATAHFLHYTDYEIDWYYDDNIPPQSVGEGANIVLPDALYNTIKFEHTDLKYLDGTFKEGIKKINWGANDFMHTFPPPFVSYHFNANKLQEFIRNLVENNKRITTINKNIPDPFTLDSDFVMSCKGFPNDYAEYQYSDVIPVNSVYVTQCFWDKVEFQHTLTIARPYGWVFGIPLQNRCSIGYLFNKDINSLEEVKEDVKEVFKMFKLNPSDKTNRINFKNYYRKNLFEKNVAFTGNAGFFLEPLEATSIHTMDAAQRLALDYFKSPSNFDHNAEFQTFIKQIETMIALHYYAGSKFNTDFWTFAKQIAADRIHAALDNDYDFKKMITAAINNDHNVPDYGTWRVSSFQQNLKNLGLYQDFIKMI